MAQRKVVWTETALKQQTAVLSSVAATSELELRTPSRAAPFLGKLPPTAANNHPLVPCKCRRAVVGSFQYDVDALAWLDVGRDTDDCLCRHRV